MRIMITLVGLAFILMILLFTVMGLFYVTFGQALLINGWILFALSWICAGLLGAVKQVCPYCGHLTAPDMRSQGGNFTEVCSNCGRPAIGFRNEGDQILSHGAIGCFASIPIFLILWAIFSALSFPGPGIGWPPMEESPSLTYTIAVTGYIQGIIWSWLLTKEFWG